MKTRINQLMKIQTRKSVPQQTHYYYFVCLSILYAHLFHCTDYNSFKNNSEVKRANTHHLREESTMREKCSGCLQLFLILYKTTSALHLDPELFQIMNTLKIPLDTFKVKSWFFWLHFKQAFITQITSNI